MFHPQCDVRLEVPSFVDGVGTTDVVARSDGRISGFELKYLTRHYSIALDGETYRLKNHGAHDLRRYDVVRDIQRMERFNWPDYGPSFVIALSNDPSYWNSARSDATIDSAFRLSEGRVVGGALAWANHAGEGTIRKREAPLNLRGQYAMNWRDYSTFSVRTGDFRYLCIPIP